MRSFYYTTTVGATSITDPFIVSTTIMNVKREGTGYNEVASSPAGRDFVYNNLTGSITFLNPFISGEKVFVLCL